MDNKTRIIVNHLEDAFSSVTESLDKVMDLNLNIEIHYNLEDIQNDIQKTIDNLRGVSND